MCSSDLRVIDHLQFAGYFLTVAEVVALIKENGVRVAARGSGAGSLVNHLLGISGVDPIRHGLLMERFLSPLRRALPDIDIDVESARREEIYRWILDRFGSERTACVSMMETYRVRHAVRDVGSALGMPAGDVDAFAKAFPHIRARDARNALADLPELRSSGFGRMAAEGRLDMFLDLVERLDGLPLDELQASTDPDAHDLWALVFEASRLDDIVEQTVRALEFSVLAKYTFGLAQLFNAFYHRYPILKEEDQARRRWRAAGVAYFRAQLTHALDLMGIDVPGRM
mgnify:CR=1 FL=1